MTADLTLFVDEVYPLYLAVWGKSPLQFEKLTKEYMCRLGREMPDKLRFFIWRQNGKAVAFSLCMVNGDTIYDEYLGSGLHASPWTCTCTSTPCATSSPGDPKTAANGIAAARR